MSPMDSETDRFDKKDTKPRIGVVNFEKRKHPRFTIDLPLEYRRIDSPIPETGRAVNASEGGLLVYFPEEVKVGDYLQLRLFFNDGSDMNRIEMGVRVAWVDLHLGKEWGDYRSGVKFTDIAPVDLNKLKTFLRDLSR
jgi:c-di-GMP-binding flagellar brake protein YcgR